MGLFRLKGFPGSGTFRHGIHPPERKEYSKALNVEVMPVPQTIIMPLLQHIGTPCDPLVKPKQTVAFQEKIGISKAYVSAFLHSPVAGIVQKPIMVTMPNGRHQHAVVIQPEGPQPSPEELWEEVRSKDWPWDCMSIHEPSKITQQIHDAGIVGLGGAAFPTHIKVMPNERRMIDTLMINGCECEPYLTPDYRLMVEAPQIIVTGALLAARALSAAEIIICIESNKPAAVASIRHATRQTVVKTAVVKTKYPQGSEKQLIKAVLDLDVPLGGLPSDIGVAMSNVGTMAAVARAVIKKSPLTHRVISVSGGGIREPKNLFVPIGTPVSEILQFCGGLTNDAARIIAGGPMMGFAFSDLQTPVTKGTSGITVLNRSEISSDPETACVRCGRCVDACPMNLVPTRLALASRYLNPDLAVKYHISACFECGCCSYVCPAKIRLVQLIRAGKAQVAARSR